MNHPAPDDHLDVLVIGAGQAGLAVAAELRRHDLRYLVVDAASEIGHTWRSRWDSLRLFSPAQHDALPGMAFPAPAPPLSRARVRSGSSSRVFASAWSRSQSSPSMRWLSASKIVGRWA